MERGLTTAVACAQSATSWLQRAERIDNYPGLPQISGKELLSRFRAQAADMGVVIIEQLARQIMPSGDIYMTLVGNDIIESRAIVLAMGAARPKLLPGEEDLLGRGVSWCGTCDGMFYRGKKVAVLSAWTGGIEEAEFLAGLASDVDYYLLAQHVQPENPPYRLCEGKPQSIRHEANQLVLVTDAGERCYDGIFIFRPAVSPDTLLPGLKTEGAFIPVDRRMATNLPRVYACGDCRHQRIRRFEQGGTRMKKAFRYLLPLLLLMMLTLPALADSYEFADDLTGEYLYPAGSDESTATYIYRYRYPQLAGDDESAAMFNTTYAYTADDTLAFEAPMNAGLTDGAAQATIIDVTYEVTCQTADYLSILITKHTKRPDSESTTISGHVFALTGSRAGEIISLPYMLGILTQDGKVDTWLQDRQTAKADNCVRELVWAEIERMMKSGDVPFYDGLTFEELEAAFYPEEDFYLDENGDPVFYLLENTVALPEAGILLVPISLETLLDEL